MSSYIVFRLVRSNPNGTVKLLLILSAVATALLLAAVVISTAVDGADAIDAHARAAAEKSGLGEVVAVTNPPGAADFAQEFCKGETDVRLVSMASRMPEQPPVAVLYCCTTEGCTAANR